METISGRPGLHEGLTLSCYLRVVDASSLMIRAGNASLQSDKTPIFQRSGLDQRVLETTVANPFDPRQRVSNRLRAVAKVLPDRKPSLARSDRFMEAILCGHESA
jgi:hypothetical protein